MEENGKFYILTKIIQNTITADIVIFEKYMSVIAYNIPCKIILNWMDIRSLILSVFIYRIKHVSFLINKYIEIKNNLKNYVRQIQIE